MPQSDTNNRPEPCLAQTECCKTLCAIAAACVSATDLDAMLDTVAQSASRFCGDGACQIWVIDEGEREATLQAAANPGIDALGRIRIGLSRTHGESPSDVVARLKSSILDSYACPQGAISAQTRSFVPLTADGEVVGLLVLIQQSRCSERCPGFASQAGAIVGPAIRHLREFQTIQQKASQLSTISELSKTVSSNQYVGDFLSLVVTMTAQALKFEACSIILSDPRSGQLTLKATSRSSRKEVRRAADLIERRLSARVMELRRPIVVTDSRTEREIPNCPLEVVDGLRAYMCHPLRHGDRMIGTFCGYYSQPHVFTEEEMDMIEAVAGQAALAIENSRLLVQGAIVQEMHHRVKNNLQTIASLLRLQLRHAKNETVEKALRESISRIQSIAAVHEILAGEDVGVVGMSDVIRALLKETHQMSSSPERKISTSFFGTDVFLPARLATSVAVVLNELIQNAIEHGIGHQPEGTIEVRVSEGTHNIIVSVANDGDPLPADFDVGVADRLGLQIVNTLVHGELQGTFTLTRDRLTTATIEFPTPPVPVG